MIRELFHERLREAFHALGISQAEFCRRTNLDRSTFAQVLNSDELRIPRGDTVAALAMGLNVSADWLLGISNQPQSSSEILKHSLRFESVEAPSPIDEPLYDWIMQESPDLCIRNIATSLPDCMKTKETLIYEYGHIYGEDNIADMVNHPKRKAFVHRILRNSEICMCLDTFQSLAEGWGMWKDMPEPQRKRQIMHMADMLEAYYPETRLYLYDLRTSFAVPYTLVGKRQAAVWIGNAYITYNSAEHVEMFYGHFNALVCAASVDAAQAKDYMKQYL